MSSYIPSITPLGDAGLLLRWEENPSEALLWKMLEVREQLSTELNCLIVHTYQEILIEITPTSALQNKLKALLTEKTSFHTSERKLYTIPVCYGGVFGEDLEWLSQSKGCSQSDIIQMHTATEYLVYFLGFLPGFLYLEGLQDALVTPRRANPRLRIPKGSVAIGGRQTGIYPQESPGGWHIIGRTPIALFDVRNTKPSPFKAGDRIQFEAVSPSSYEIIQSEVAQGAYHLTSVVL